MSKIHIDINKNQITAFCHKWKVIRMAFFGSVLRDDFRTDSDVDVMIAFDPKARWSLFDIVDMKLELQDIFKRDVDILEEGALRNPIKLRCIKENIEVIYESSR